MNAPVRAISFLPLAAEITGAPVAVAKGRVALDEACRDFEQDKRADGVPAFTITEQMDMREELGAEIADFAKRWAAKRNLCDFVEGRIDPKELASAIEEALEFSDPICARAAELRLAR